MNRIKEAEKFLKDNIEVGGLTPESSEWRESKFQLGRVLFKDAARLETDAALLGFGGEDPQNDDQAIDADLPGKDQAIDKLEKSHKRFQESINELRNAVNREALGDYSDRIPTFEYRYLLAEANRRSAIWPSQKSQRVSFPDTKTELKEEVIKFCQEAHLQFDALVDDLSKLADNKELTEIESKILRNAYLDRKSNV